MPTPSGPSSLPITLEDFKRVGMELGGLDELVRRAAVSWDVRFGSLGVLSEFCLAHGITLDTWILSDKTGFRIGRSSQKPDNSANSHTERAGQGQISSSVCVKLLRFQSRSERKLVAIKQRFYHESARWKQISHPNLIPVFGVSDVSSQGRISLAVITLWVSNENIIKYLENNQGANRLELLVQVASGLEHLHSLGIIHGRISPGNILVNENGQACLGDFGINQIASRRTVTGPECLMSIKPNTRRYMPPELLNLDQNRRRHSEAGDIYSLAMIAFEVLTGIVPYGEFLEDTIPHRVIRGERPIRPTNPLENLRLSDPVWEMFEDCWNNDPDIRWEARCMRHRFSNPTTARVQGMPCVGGALRPVGFAVRLHQLQPDDCPKYLAKCLKYAPNEAQEEGTKTLLEVFDKVLGYRPFDPLISKRFRKLCGHKRVVPASYAIPTERISIVGEHAVAYGGFGDVWRGTYGVRDVAIKALRVYKNDDIHKVKRAFYKEVTIWKRLSHPNIVPFLGVTNAPAPLSMVSEWMPNGDIQNYVREHPEVDRIQLLLDICHGLQILHTYNVVHGDLKGANVLINDSGWACLTDFGLSSIAILGCTESSAHGPCGTFRWTAPELLRLTETQPNPPTKNSDIYAFAMVAIEVFTGQLPFESCKRSLNVMLKVMKGERPTRPAAATKLGLTDGLWHLIQTCWAQDPQRRPAVDTIIDFLLRAA